jgi:hypothetical protein
LTCTFNVSLFLFKAGSRNRQNNNRADGYFSEHYQHLFGLRLPHQDAVHDVLCNLSNETVEHLKMDMMSRMFEQKWLRDYRLLGKYNLWNKLKGFMIFCKPVANSHSSEKKYLIQPAPA